MKVFMIKDLNGKMSQKNLLLMKNAGRRQPGIPQIEYVVALDEMLMLLVTTYRRATKFFVQLSFDCYLVGL
jgi:hypothetical protein